MKRKRSDPAVGLAQQCGQGTGVLRSLANAFPAGQAVARRGGHEPLSKTSGVVAADGGG